MDHLKLLHTLSLNMLEEWETEKTGVNRASRKKHIKDVIEILEKDWEKEKEMLTRDIRNSQLYEIMELLRSPSLFLWAKRSKYWNYLVDPDEEGSWTDKDAFFASHLEQVLYGYARSKSPLTAEQADAVRCDQIRGIIKFIEEGKTVLEWAKESPQWRNYLSDEGNSWGRPHNLLAEFEAALKSIKN
jgi:hypothetical protein